MRPKRTICLAALALVAALVTPSPARAEARQTQDFFVGNGTVGPFTLSWKHILPGTEKVTINDVPLTWGVDYTLDPDAGMLTFTHPLPTQAGAVIRYGFDTQQAQAQSGGLNLPLALALGENVSVSGLYSHAPADGEKPGALNLGLNGGWQGANDSKLSTHLLFAPALTGADSQATPNGLARLGVAVGGQTNLGKPLQLGFGFSRAGTGVGSQGGDNWQAGLQKINLNGAYDPSRQVKATFGYLQTDSATGRGPASSQINAALALTPSDKARLQTSLVQTDGGSGPVQTLSAAASLAPSKGATLDADWTQKNADGKADASQVLNLKAALTSGKTLALTATDSQAAVGQGGTTQTQTLAATIKPSDGAEMDASFNQKDAPDKAGDAQDVNLKAILGGKNLSLTASAGQSTVGDKGTTQTLAANAVIKPVDKTELDASFSQKDAPGRQDDSQALNLKAALATGKAVSLTASLNQSTQGTQDSSAQSVRLSLSPHPTFQFDTGVSQRRDPDANTQAVGVDGKMQPWAFLLLSGGYQWRTVTPAQTGGTVVGDYDTSNAQFTLAPKAALHLVGTYAQNPDDAGGNPQRLAQHGLSLETKVGALSLTGGYDWSSRYAASATATALHVGVGLRFSANTQLTGDYKQNLTTTGLAPAGATAYSLSLTRNLGEAFSLSLSGAVNQPVGPAGSASPATDPVTASAKLGMKF
ncbi:MAG: hypothetical protein JO250_24450 [Armatimonadetes bacterium]|nr:hypothetical protein [Armatimonadota bacterium]